MKKTVVGLTLFGILTLGSCDSKKNNSIEEGFYKTPTAQATDELNKRYKRVERMYPGLEMQPVIEDNTFYGVQASGKIDKNRDLFLPWLHYITTGYEPTEEDISRPEMQYQKDVLVRVE